MNITLFNKKYWLRRFSPQQELYGYLTSEYNDIVVEMNVHPLSSDQVQALPEGERTVKHLSAESSVPIYAQNPLNDTKADLLLYNGEWYECTSSQYFDHTILSHWNSQFVLVPFDSSKTGDLENPPLTAP